MGITKGHQLLDPFGRTRYESKPLLSQTLSMLKQVLSPLVRLVQFRLYLVTTDVHSVEMGLQHTQFLLRKPNRNEWSAASFLQYCAQKQRVRTSLTSEKALRKSLLPRVILASISFLKPPPLSSAALIPLPCFSPDSLSDRSSSPSVSSAALVPASSRFDVSNR